MSHFFAQSPSGFPSPSESHILHTIVYLPLLFSNLIPYILPSLTLASLLFPEQQYCSSHSSLCALSSTSTSGSLH